MTHVLWQMPREEEAKPPVVGRLVGSFVVGVFLLFYGSGLAAWLALVVMTSCSIALVVATHRVSTTTIIRLHLVFALVLEIVVSVAVPSAWPVMCLVAASTITAGVFGQRDKASLLLGLGGALVMAAIGVLSGSDHWVWFSIGLLLIGPIAVSTSRIVDVVQDQQADALTTLSSSVDAIIWEQVAEGDGQMLTVAGASESLTGYSPADWANLDHLSRVHPDDLEGFRSIEHGNSWEGRIQTANGKWRYIRETFRVYEDPDREIKLLQGMTVDINEITEARHLADWRADYDQLTKLPNRSLLLTSAESALAESNSIVLFVINIERFKHMNETLGFDVGDQYLQIFAHRLRNLAERKSAIAARLGNDEFAFLVTSEVTMTEIGSIADEIVETVGSRVRINDATVQRSVAIGVAISSGQDRDLVSLIRRADTAVDQAKNSLSTWMIGEAENLKRVEERFFLAAQVEEAIKDQQFRLWFQPKIDLITRRVAGFEGLIRWHHPDHGVLQPWRFLDVIDISGHSRSFDRLVVEQAIEFAAQCHRAGHPITISVNVPGRSIREFDMVHFIERTLDMWSFPASSLVVELTEDAINEDLSRIVPTMNSLAELGCGLSIDDFGTGHSSLTRLRELPATELKIDKSFVMTLPEDKDNQLIVKSTLHLAGLMGLHCVAEGVESEDALEMLREFGCRTAQGFLFSRPVPRDEAHLLLNEDVIAAAN